jgi:pimeloyl-ACP methyl ester carboxylesterase
LPTFLLLPGLDGTARLFARLVPYLPDGWFVRPVPYPAVQALCLDELEELVLQAAPENDPYVIIAESFSGPIGVRVASKNPTGLTALVLVASFVTPPMGAIMRWLVRLCADLAVRLPLSPNMVTTYLLRENADEESIAEVQAAVRPVRPHVLASRLRMAATLDVRSDLEACTLPILYLAGSQDRLVPRDRTDEVAALYPQTIVRTLPAPHLVLHSEPELAGREISEFLGTSTRGA